MINLIVAYDKNRGIGYQGKMPWFYRNDLLHFRRKTLNSTVIMGRTTYEGLPQSLDQRYNIVLTSKEKKRIESDVIYSDSLENALELGKCLKREIYIIGGESLYNECLDKKIPDKLICSEIALSFKCDRFFPRVNGYYLDCSYDLDTIILVKEFLKND